MEFAIKAATNSLQFEEIQNFTDAMMLQRYTCLLYTSRNDGIDRTVARNQDLETPADVEKVQEHNEREKDSYSNQDIVPERTVVLYIC